MQRASLAEQRHNNATVAAAVRTMDLPHDAAQPRPAAGKPAQGPAAALFVWLRRWSQRARPSLTVISDAGDRQAMLDKPWIAERLPRQDRHELAPSDVAKRERYTPWVFF